MRACKTCGVQVEDKLDVCPLCGEPVSEQRRYERMSEERTQNVLQAGARIESESERTVRGAKIWLFEMVSLVAFTAGIVIFAADFSSGFALEWSLIPLLAIVSLYVAVSAIIAFHRHLVLLLIVETAVVAGFLMVLSTLVEEANWFLTIALPVTLLVALVSGLAATTVARLKLNALQAVAVTFLGSGFFVVGLEFILNYAMGGDFLVSWSLIAFACTLSLFVLILFINKRLKEHHAEFRKIFHI
jgi:hypothetical protein